MLPAKAASPSAKLPRIIDRIRGKRSRRMVSPRKAASLPDNSYRANWKSVEGTDRVLRRRSSHVPAALIELVAIDNRLDVLARSGKIDVL